MDKIDLSMDKLVINASQEGIKFILIQDQKCRTIYSVLKMII